jgi:RNA polymerase sigma factor (TIGR02999 family)
VSLDHVLALSTERSDQLIALDDALARLAVIDPRQARIVELRFFGGLTEEETAEVLGVSSRTIKRDWSAGKAWLYGEMTT